MKLRHTNSNHLAPALRWFAVLCLMLVAASVAAQALHSHPDDFAGTSKHCPICPVLHATVRVAQTFHLDVTFSVAAYLHRAAAPGWTVVVDSAPLFSRPPPLA